MRVTKDTALFIDAGFSHCGAVVIETSTDRVLRAVCIRTSPDKKESATVGNARRCRELVMQLETLRRDYLPTFVGGELPHGGSKSAKAMQHMAFATAVVAAWEALKGFTFIKVTPNQIKKLIRPKGEVTKDDIFEFVTKRFKYKFPTKKEVREHICDAAAAYVVADMDGKIQR